MGLKHWDDNELDQLIAPPSILSSSLWLLSLLFSLITETVVLDFSLCQMVCQPLDLRDMNILLAITWIAITQVIADGHNPISQPAANSIVPTGVLYTIKWSPGTPGPVFIALLTNTDGSNITSEYSRPSGIGYHNAHMSKCLGSHADLLASRFFSFYE